MLDTPIADLPNAQSELAVERWFAGQAARNLDAGKAAFFCGAGAYRHHIPASVDHIIQRSEFLTSYTPYQPEISQGSLQALFEFQTQVARLTGMDLANASMYDGATAAAEAVLMACRLTRRNKVLLSRNLHPHYAQACKTLGQAQDIEFVTLPAEIEGEAIGQILAHIDQELACLVMQNPDFFGHLRDLSPLSKAVHKVKALLVGVVTEIVSSGLIKTPGEMGADIVAAEGQSLGVGLQFGGPHVGLLSCRNERSFLRQLPGRLCGETVDVRGQRGFVLTLSTREQHIRRGKATSNICTNSGLIALAFSIHASLLGEKGVREMACQSHARTVQLHKALEPIKAVKIWNTSFFNEFSLRLPTGAAQLVDQLSEEGILAGVPVARLLPGHGFEKDLLVACTERTTQVEIETFAKMLQKVLA